MAVAASHRLMSDSDKGKFILGQPCAMP
jgi:hypothetical protein